jgi:hypothetical protein
VTCTYRLSDRQDPSRWAELPSLPFNALSGVVRKGDAAYATLQWNGYAAEIRGRGNVVVALDLCAHTTLWTSANLSSNAALLLHGDTLITGYGFTAEKHYLEILNRWTGAEVQRLPLPKSPDDLRVKDGTLYVHLYDGYAAIPLR